MRSRLAVFCKFGPLLLALCATLPPSALALTASQVYEQVKDSVVVVKAYDQQGKPVGQGSGVMLPLDDVGDVGNVITNYHVVKAGVRYTVGRGKQATPATLKAGDPDKDICLLTAPGLVAEPARLGKTARLKVGEPVYAVGAPQGLELSLSEGIVSQLRGGPPPIIQTTVAISQGSSGGGLFNAEGELVGITTFYLKEGQSLNFALPVEWIGEIATRKNQKGPRVEAPEIPERGDRPKDGWADRGRPPVKTRFTKAANGVISDSTTGLEWYVGPNRDTDWNQANDWTQSLAAAGGGWRIPTLPELKTLYQRGAGPNNMDTIFHTTGNMVWSGQKINPYTAGSFDFYSGQELWPSVTPPPGGREYVRNYRAFAVRSLNRGRPPEKTRFTKAANGVISDSATGLEWYAFPDRDTNWYQAKSWTENLTAAGGGWRMPTIAELKTLYQRGVGPHNMDPIFQTTGTWVWSGELKDALSAWYFYFGDGPDYLHDRERWSHLGTAGRAFAVRSRRR
jgi:hypothetical protein